MFELQCITSLFEENRNSEHAEPMQKYMKNHFPFLGIKAPLRKELMKTFYSETSILKQEFNSTLVEHLWAKEEREFQYAALDYIKKLLRKINVEHLPLMEKLITTKSWWDTVDVIAPHPVGKIAKDTPSVIDEIIEGWAISDHLWLRRSSLIFQLRYKEETDEARLYRFITLNADGREFFIQKAIGWALREYSKTNPDSVRHFIKTNELPKLSIREGSKYI